MFCFIENMATQSSCAICGSADSWRHELLDCNMAKCVWALEREEIGEHMSMIQELDSRSWLSVLFSTLTQEELTWVVVTMWAIWYARRKVIFENSFQSPLSTVDGEILST
jgi:hypothetical protein